MEHIHHIWPRMSDLATDLAVPYTTAASWKARGIIPSDYDGPMIAAAAARGHVLTLEVLASARQRAREAHRARRAKAA